MPFTEADAQAVFARIVDPNTGKDFAATRAARNIKLSGGGVSLDVELGYRAKASTSRSGARSSRR